MTRKRRRTKSHELGWWQPAALRAGTFTLTAIGFAAATFAVVDRGDTGRLTLGIIFLGALGVFVSNVSVVRRLPKFVVFAALAVLGAVTGVIAVVAVRDPGAPCEAEDHLILPTEHTVSETGPTMSATPTAISAGQLGIWVATAGGLLFPIDPESRQVLEPIDIRRFVGGQPFDVAQGLDAVWVTGAGRLLKLDPVTGQKLWVETLGVRPGEVEVGLGSAWYKDYGRGVVWRLDLDSGLKEEQLSLNGPQGAGGKALRATAFTLGSNSIWVTTDSRDESEEQLVEFSRDGEVLRKIRVQEDPQDLIEAVGYVFVNHATGNKLTRVGLQSKEEDQAEARFYGGLPSGIAESDDSLWVPGADTNSVDRVDTEDFASAGRCIVGGYPVDVAVINDRAWVASQEGQEDQEGGEITVVQARD